MKKAEQKKAEQEEVKKTEETKIEEEKTNNIQKSNPEIAIKEEPLTKPLKEKQTEEKIEEKTNSKFDEIEIETSEEKPAENKKVVIPSVRDKKKENRDINILLYLVGAIAILLFLVVIYLFMNKDDLSNVGLSMKNKEISTEKVL